MKIVRKNETHLPGFQRSILAAAKAANVHVLATLDQRHLLDRPELEKFIAGRILRPKQAYEWALAEDG